MRTRLLPLLFSTLLVTLPLSTTHGAFLVVSASNFPSGADFVELLDPFGAAAVPAGTPVRIGTYADPNAVDDSNFGTVQMGFTEFAVITTLPSGFPPEASGFFNDSVTLDDSIPPVLGNVPTQISLLIGGPQGWAAVTNPAWQTLPVPLLPAPQQYWIYHSPMPGLFFSLARSCPTEISIHRRDWGML